MNKLALLMCVVILSGCSLYKSDKYGNCRNTETGRYVKADLCK
jgi:hypothetical protein